MFKNISFIRRPWSNAVARTLNEAPITSRNARAGLPAGLHWRGIDPETHLGYRKGKRGGVWLGTLAEWRGLPPSANRHGGQCRPPP
jgi:hypothetical protein